MSEEVLEEQDPFQDYEVREVAKTDGEHYYVEDSTQDPNSNLVSVICTHCPSGLMIDGDKFEVVDGKIKEKDGK